MKNTKKSNKTLCIALALPLILSTGGVLFDPAPLENQTHNLIEFTPWTDTASLPDAEGSYYLVNDVTLTSTWEVPVGTVNLCLNGNVIDVTPEPDPQKKYDERMYECILVGTDSTLSIYDCDSTKENYFKDVTTTFDGDEISYWSHDDTLTGEDIKHTILGGAIIGGPYNAISAEDGGEFNFHGGTICGTQPLATYGPVSIDYGTFNMYEGATITQNSSQQGGGVVVSGNSENGVFNMYGGVISNNSSITSYDEMEELVGGGGVFLEGGTFNMYNGLITGNSAIACGGGILATMNATFNMYDGEISNNVAYTGGGIHIGNGYYSCTVNLKGGKIINNSAIDNGHGENGVGGGIFVQDQNNVVIDGCLISGNNADYNGGGIYLAMPLTSDPYYCVAEGTKVTSGDGTTKNVEDLELGEEIRVFDHETGELSTSEIFNIERTRNVKYDAFTLGFTNDIEVIVVSGHSFFCQETNTYETLGIYTSSSYIGKHFYNADANRWEELLTVTDYEEPIDSYSIATSGTINFVTNGMLSCGDEIYTTLSNIFTFDTDLKYEATAKATDIETYGIFEFEDCHYATKETYDNLNLKYLKVAMGKGLIDLETLQFAAQYQGQVGSGLTYSRTVYIGGNTKVINNTVNESTQNNLFVWDNTTAQVIQVGTGADGNGVTKPTEEMSVGVTIGHYEYLVNEEVINLHDCEIVDSYYVSYFEEDGEEGIVYQDSSYRRYYIWNGTAYEELIPVIDTSIGYFSDNGTVADLVYFTPDEDTKVVKCVDDRLAVVYNPVTKPTFETTTFTFDGNEKDFEVPTNDLYTITGATKGTDVGTYEVTLSLKDKKFGFWSDGTQEDLTYTFTINNAPVDKPTFETTEFTFDGNEKDFNVPTNDLYEITGTTKATNVGTYEVKLSLKDKDYTTWADGSTEDLTYTFVINNAPVAKPTFETTEFTFDGTEKDFGIPTNDLYEITGATKATNVGTYEVKLSLKDKDHTTWADGTTDDLTYTFEITKASLEVPTVEETKFVCDGTEKDFGIPTNDLYTITGATKATEPGYYEVTLSLKDKNCSAWVDGTTSDITYNFVINQKASDVEIIVEGAEASPFVIEAGEEGIMPEAVLVVKVIAVENETDIQNAMQALTDANLLGKYDSLVGLYDAKLLLNDVEVQPDGTIRIRMVIPEELIGKEFSLYHIHTGEPVENITGKVVIEFGSLTFETDKLSQFAFVAKTKSSCFTHWIILALLIVGAALFIVLKYVLNKNLIALFEATGFAVIGIVCIFFAGCDICYMLDTIYMIIFIIFILMALIKDLKEKNNKEKEEGEPITLKENFGKMASVAVSGSISKKFIADYLTNKYGKEVEVNCRANTTNPGRGQSKGLPLADTHYIVKKKFKKCFIYVYEDEEGRVMLLIDTTKEYVKELKKEHKHIHPSAFPKSIDYWYSVIIDDTWNVENLPVMLDKVIELIKG